MDLFEIIYKPFCTSNLNRSENILRLFVIVSAFTQWSKGSNIDQKYNLNT